LAVWPWRCWPMPQLAVPFPAGHVGGGGRLRCRLSSVALPWCLHDPAAVAGVRSAGRLRLPVSTGHVRGRRVGPPMSAGGADLARNPGASAEPDTAAVSAGRPGLRPGAGRRPPSAADTATAPMSRAETWRSPTTVPARPSATTVDPGRRTRCPQRQHNLDAGSCPDQGVRRTTECRRLPALRQCVRGASGTAPAWRWCPDGWGPPPTPPPPAGGCCYRKRSPARRPLVGSRQCRDARAS
jgi:hypothetical protein